MAQNTCHTLRFHKIRILCFADLNLEVDQQLVCNESKWVGEKGMGMEGRELTKFRGYVFDTHFVEPNLYMNENTYK